MLHAGAHQHSRQETSLLTLPAFFCSLSAIVMASATAARFMLIFYVPPSAAQACKAAIFKAGAGRYPTTQGAPSPRQEPANSVQAMQQIHISGRSELWRRHRSCGSRRCLSEKTTKDAVAALKRSVPIQK
jgi:hypothetical protein